MQVPFPGCEALTAAAEKYPAALPGADYYGDLTRAHRAAGLLHEHAVGDKRCAIFHACLRKNLTTEFTGHTPGSLCSCAFKAPFTMAQWKFGGLLKLLYVFQAH